MCGHRLKEHNGKTLKCAAKKAGKPCECKKFFYILAQGAWILRCRCKHKHIEHEPNPPYKCAKPNCKGCDKGFDSPFVCNCDHGWVSHEQRVLAKNEAEDFSELLPANVKRGQEKEPPRFEELKDGEE
uniref:Protein FAM221A n=2 Tax=Palpitomonas bilix TaxID=652834 RepID=A0A7S3DM51_9EUKA|mmetsp:Transcript_42065/g.108266  ORF Transcript_42065/g.108266 Transcript_42065/m.108266 type:complete len:128 (+) Transcript_42065:335-718(+)